MVVEISFLSYSSCCQKGLYGEMNGIAFIVRCHEFLMVKSIFGEACYYIITLKGVTLIVDHIKHVA